MTLVHSNWGHFPRINRISWWTRPSFIALSISFPHSTKTPLHLNTPRTMSKPGRCIIDCDPGIDDTLAILHAMGSPKVDVVAITLTYGNTNRDNVTKNLFTVLHVLGKEVHASRTSTLPE